VVRIGDAVPRKATGKSLREVVRPQFRDDTAPRIELVPWSVHNMELGIGEDAQARRFIADSSVVAVVGHAGSRATLMVESLYRDAGLPMLVPTATARSLHLVGPHVFMLAPTDDLIGAFLIDEASTRLGAKRIGLLYVADPYGEGIRDGVQARLQARGESPVGMAALSGLECEGETHGLDAVVAAFLQRHAPDAVIVALPQEAAWCAVRALAREAPTVAVLTTDSFVLDETAPLTAAERANTHALLFWEPGADSASQAFVAGSRRFMRRDPYPGEALEFDAFQLVAAAIRAGNTTRPAIMAWLRQLGTPGHPPYQGVTGPIEFTKPRTSVLRLKALRDQPPAP
jgi:branched-chain amino acid transport system substrate-binding protein